MKKLLWFGLALTVFAAAAPSMAQDNTAQHTIILYSPLQYHDHSRVSVDFQAAAYAPPYRFGDVGYGSLRVGAEFDWLEISTAQDRRSVILDLGKYDWSDKFMVPWVEPLARLKPGEHRTFFVDSSGKDGKDGKPGFDGMDGRDGLDGLNAPNSRNASNSIEPPSTNIPERPREPIAPRKPKNDGQVRTSPSVIRAVLGHMYVIHVVDDKRDFYALARIESLQRGDNCTISWKLIPPPEAGEPIK